MKVKNLKWCGHDYLNPNDLVVELIKLRTILDYDIPKAKQSLTLFIKDLRRI